MKHVDLNELEPVTTLTFIPDPHEQEKPPEDAPAPQPTPAPVQEPAPPPQVLHGRELVLALRKWAMLIVDHKGPVGLVHGLEYRTPSWLNSIGVHQVRETPFWIAASSGEFPGLSEHSSVGDVIRYFDLSAYSVHAFTCDCGGEIEKGDMAQRLLNIANNY